MSLKARDHFTTLVSGPEDELNLGEAALLIAQEEQPELNVSFYLNRLAMLADAVRSKTPAGASPEETIEALNNQLFFEERLHGNAKDYYDPKNSFLNEVLDRKTGIPITLCVIYLEVGRLIGLSLVGVGFPGHFLVKHVGDEVETVLDPFMGGVTLTFDQLAAKLKTMYGEGNPLVARVPELLQPAGKKEILARMLRNLKGVYLHKGDFQRALSAIDRIILVTPDLASEFRDRGSVRQRLGQIQGAVQDYKKYIELAPDAKDAGQIRTLVQRSLAQLN